MNNYRKLTLRVRKMITRPRVGRETLMDLFDGKKDTSEYIQTVHNMPDTFFDESNQLSLTAMSSRSSTPALVDRHSSSRSEMALSRQSSQRHLTSSEKMVIDRVGSARSASDALERRASGRLTFIDDGDEDPRRGSGPGVEAEPQVTTQNNPIARITSSDAIRRSSSSTSVIIRGDSMISGSPKLAGKRKAEEATAEPHSGKRSHMERSGL